MGLFRSRCGALPPRAETRPGAKSYFRPRLNFSSPPRAEIWRWAMTISPISNTVLRSPLLPQCSSEMLRMRVMNKVVNEIV